MNCWLNKYMHFSVLEFSLVVYSTLCVHVLANSLPASLQQIKPCHDQEKLALLHFKHSFQINCSIASISAFARPKLESWWDSSSSHTSDCCNWDGVMCDDETGHVIGLDLSSSCLFGTFPQNSTIFGLNNLRQLHLSDNHFNFSQIPSDIGRLSKLTVLNLSQSSFTGQIPVGVSRLSSLSILDLSRNVLQLQFEMRFEKFVGNLSRLSRLHLGNVDISSQVPVVLSNFTSLQSLVLVSNNLFGNFPSQVFLLPKLEKIALVDNHLLGGNLPEFPTNSALRQLKVFETSFSGELTSSIGNLGNLTELVIMDTSLTGSIPSSLSFLTKLSELRLKSNFYGDLPLSLTNLTQLSKLHISDVYIESHILNSWLTKLTKLDNLTLRKVFLTGKIPPALANLTRLTWLDLSFNQLTGCLPGWLANKTALSLLDLGGNKLQGPMIPQWFSQLVNLKTIVLSSDGRSEAMFETLLKLPYLTTLSLLGINLNFPLDVGSTNSSLPKFGVLGLSSCNLIEFPQFLRYQTELKILDLSRNDIVGTIPQWFVNTTAKHLLELSVSGNKLYGVIPNDICRASSMFLLDLSMNNFRGQIPVCISAQLSASLTVLNLGGNRLEGPIPHTFSNACKLKQINLGDNQLDGGLPKSLTNCGLLEFLDLGENDISDTFPSWLGNLPKLQVLILRHNKFHGWIADPESDHYFSCLRMIDISYNFHFGNLPSKYLQIWLSMNVIITESSKDSIQVYPVKNPRFQIIDFSSNDFGGDIPDIIGNLIGLAAVDLSNNHFTGEIPSSLANINALEALDLSQNMLSGKIPGKFRSLPFLEIFNVSHNRLVGPIPQGSQFSTFDNSSFIGNLELCGPPLSNPCRKSSYKREESKVIDWILRSLGFVEGCIIGFIIGKIFITDPYHDWFMKTFGRKKAMKPR
ncbi:unnamed protein product [Amaranthus hypochondriacus]